VARAEHQILDVLTLNVTAQLGAQRADRLKAILLEGDWYELWPADGRDPRTRNGNDRTTQAAEPAPALASGSHLQQHRGRPRINRKLSA